MGHNPFLVFAVLMLISDTVSQHKRPNIVVFLADDLGTGDVGIFGNTSMNTPNIDNIGKSGVVLTHHLAAEAICTPSRAAFLTGRYPIRYGMASTHRPRVTLFLSSVFGLPPEETTFAKALQNSGYSTALVGKWHLGLHCGPWADFCHHPLNHGFDYYYGLPLTNLKDFGDASDEAQSRSASRSNPNLLMLAAYTLFWMSAGTLALYFARVIRFSMAVLLFLGLSVPALGLFTALHNLKYMNSYLMRSHDYVEHPVRFENLTQRLVQEGVQFLERQQNSDRPFLLFVSWPQVHTVLHCAREFRASSKYGAYGDNVQEMDWGVGAILSALDKLGMRENTFVYFTSDNGGALDETSLAGQPEGGHNGIYKGGKYQGGQEGGIRMPTVAMMPGLIPKGHVTSTPTSHMDLFPTLMDLAGIDSLNRRLQLDGQSMMNVLRKKPASKRQERFLFHYCGDVIHAARYISETGPVVWKLHYAIPNWLPGTQDCDGPCDCRSDHTWLRTPLLYDIASDPTETKPVAPSAAEYGRVLRAINAARDKHLRSIDANVTNQFAFWRMLPLPHLQPCCGRFPSCECRDMLNP